MLDNIKYLIQLKTIDKEISNKNYDIALERLNNLVKNEIKPSETFLKRGKLCKELLMYEDAYSDFTYIITHCVKKKKAYYERAKLNYEMENFAGAINDSYKVLSWDPENEEYKHIILLSFIYSGQDETARNYVLDMFEFNKFKAIQYLFNETAIVLTQDELAKGLKLLRIVNLIDPDNPIKLLKESNIYQMAGYNDKTDAILTKIESAFPKYFTSHFKFSDMYQPKDLLEISFLLELKPFDKKNLFEYPFKILEGYKNHIEGHIIDAKECFEKAIKIDSKKPEGYILLAQTYQLMSGYDNPEYLTDAKKNYTIALGIYRTKQIPEKVDEMKRQLKHISSRSTIYNIKL